MFINLAFNFPWPETILLKKKPCMHSPLRDCTSFFLKSVKYRQRGLNFKVPPLLQQGTNFFILMKNFQKITKSPMPPPLHHWGEIKKVQKIIQIM